MRTTWFEINKKLDECIVKDDLKSKFDYANKALHEAQRSFGKNHDKTGISHYVLGTLYVQTGQTKFARRHLEQAWKIHKRLSTDEGCKLAPGTFQTLYNFYSANKQQNRVIRLLLESIDVWEKKLNQWNEIYINVLKALSKEYARKFGPAKVEKLLVSKLELVSNKYRSKNRLYGCMLGRLGLLYLSCARPIEAIANLEEAVVILEKKNSDYSQDYASFLSMLFKMYKAKGKHTQARDIYLRVLSWTRSSPDIKNVYLFRIMSQTLWDVGDFGKSQPLLEQLVKIYKAEIHKDHPDDIPVNIVASLDLETNKLTSAHRPYIIAQQRLANLHIILGEYQLAAYIYSGIWKMSRTICGLKNLDLTFYVMGDMGSMLFGKRSYNPAWKTDPDVLNYIESLVTAARLFFAIGDYSSYSEVGQAAFTYSKAVLGTKHPYYLQNLTTYAQMEMAVGQQQKAFNYYRECVNTSLTVLGDKSPVFREALSGLAYLYQTCGMTSEALDMYLKALSTYDKKDPLHAFSMFNLNLAIACIYASSEKITDAIHYLLENVSIYNKILSNIMAYGYNQRLDEYMASFLSVYHMLFSLFVKHRKDLAGFVEQVYSVLINRKAVILEWAVQKKIHLKKSKDPALAETFYRLSKLQEDFASKLNRSRFFPLTAGLPENQIVEEYSLEHYAREIRDLEKSIAAQLPQYEITSGIRQAYLSEIVTKIPTGYVLIDFVHYREFTSVKSESGGEKYAAFIVNKDCSDLQVVDIGEASVVENLVVSLKNEITDWGESWLKNRNVEEKEILGTFFTETAQTLFQTLMAPILAVIGSCKKMLISADGVLFELPFEILPLHGNRYMIEEYDIEYVDAVRDLLSFDDPVTPQSASLIVADPDFDLCANLSLKEAATSVSYTKSKDGSCLAERIRSHFSDDWPGFIRLEGAREEGRYVYDLIGPGATLWQGDQALKGKLIKVCRPQILHIATHGFVYPKSMSQKDGERGIWFGQFYNPEQDFSEITDNPLLRSGLLMAGANSFLRGKPIPADAEDGILTAVDISGMDLAGTDLVVLSACSSGLGEVKPGEGVYGMRRAFILAGARSLLVSLWPVPDQETKELLSRFYTGLIQGLTKSTALKEAKIAMINDLRLRRDIDHPFIWGAFTSIGNPCPIERSIQ